jgi:uncharacterized membrane protein
VPKLEPIDHHSPQPVGAARAGGVARPAPGLVAAATTIGAIAAGAALLDMALIPGMAIGGAALLAPRYVPGLRRRLLPLFSPRIRPRLAPSVAMPERPLDAAPPAVPGRFAIKRALAKTITFRIIVTTLDFTANYVVIGELATAAGLSAFALAAGPVFYFVHEALWHSVGASVRLEAGEWGPAVNLQALLPIGAAAGAPPAGRRGFTISRALAKTITFRTIATTMDFTTNYVVVGDLATAATLSAFGFVVGPFIYLGHEMAWDRYGAPQERVAEAPDLSRIARGVEVR